MTRYLTALLGGTMLLASPVLAQSEEPASPTYEECVAEWTAFFGTDTQYDDATRAIAMDGLSHDERVRMETCDVMLDGGRALNAGE